MRSSPILYGLCSRHDAGRMSAYAVARGRLSGVSEDADAASPSASMRLTTTAHLPIFACKFIRVELRLGMVLITMPCEIGRTGRVVTFHRWMRTRCMSYDSELPHRKIDRISSCVSGTIYLLI
jgi:hypothetical protein